MVRRNKNSVAERDLEGDDEFRDEFVGVVLKLIVLNYLHVFEIIMEFTNSNNAHVAG